MIYKDLFSNDLPIYESKKTGLKFYYRPNTSDIKTIMEVVEKGCYEKTYFKIEKGEHWVDLGGNIGAFTCLAISKGATVDVYEPDDMHCDLIKKNLELNGFKANIIQKAVVVDAKGKINLFIGRNGNTWRNSLLKDWGFGKKEVKTISIRDVINKDHCCKMDIEGFEMPIIESLNCRFKKLVFEWSFDIDNNIERYRNASKKMEKQYEIVHWGKIKEEHTKWKKEWFPPCKTIFCY
jgi:FkbM family methyltransferase